MMFDIHSNVVCLQIDLPSKYLIRSEDESAYSPAPLLSITRLLSQPIICRAPAALDFICEVFMKVLSHTHSVVPAQEHEMLL